MTNSTSTDNTLAMLAPLKGRKVKKIIILFLQKETD